MLDGLNHKRRISFDFFYLPYEALVVGLEDFNLGFYEFLGSLVLELRPLEIFLTRNEECNPLFFLPITTPSYICVLLLVPRFPRVVDLQAPVELNATRLQEVNV